MKPMNEAPTDGTRILIWERTNGYCTKKMRYVSTGERWVEGWCYEGKWEEWCGSPTTHCTGTLDPLGWIDLPPKGFEIIKGIGA